MKPFAYTRATEERAAIQTVASNTEAKFIAGGTNLLDLMKGGVTQPSQLVDITRLPLTKIEVISGGVRIGALAKNSDVANNQLIKERYPLLSEAFLQVPQHNCETWQVWVEICCKERAATTSPIRRCLAINANPVLVVPQLKGIIGFTLSWVQVTNVLRLILLICVWHWQRWMQRFAFKERTGYVQFPSPSFIGYQVIHQKLIPSCNKVS
jgi:hypothetical protein